VSAGLLEPIQDLQPPIVRQCPDPNLNRHIANLLTVDRLSMTI
jgi:hypothetical protein